MIFLDFATDFMNRGVIRSLFYPYEQALGVTASFFYIILIGATVTFAYMKSNNSFFPLVIMLVAGATMPSVIGEQGLRLGWGLIVISVVGIMRNVVKELKTQ